MPHTITKSKCIGCGMCLDICPTGAVGVNLLITDTICKDCGECAKQCPGEAIFKLEEKQ